MFIVDEFSTNFTTKICNVFCTPFFDHQRNINSSIPFSTFLHLDPIEFYEKSMQFRNATGTDIIESIMQLDKEVCINDVSGKFLVICKNCVSYYMKELLNLCVTSGVYPNVFIIYQITPIHNKGYFHSLPNYRPVSVLSKLFESLIQNRLQSFCQTPNFPAKNQFGFRENRDTELTTLTLMDKFIPVLEEKKNDKCFFLKYSACFHTISRSILHDKLERYVIHGVILDFIKVYFANRSQYLCCDAFK